jgi:uncharacterized Rmd1/YagE family protein
MNKFILRQLPSRYFNIRCFSTKFNYKKLLAQNSFEINLSDLNKRFETTLSVQKESDLKAQKLKRIKKKKASELHQDDLKVIALSTADSYDLVNLKKAILNEGLYEIIDITNDPDRDVLCFKAKYKSAIAKPNDETRIIFVFNDGTCLFWNVEDKNEKNSILQLINNYAINLYDEELVKSEIEVLTYSLDDKIEQTRLNKNHINFATNSNDILLEKYTFSDAISSSIKLGILESKLENFVETIEHISEDLKYARKMKLSSQQVLQKTGDLFTMRHLINLRFDFLNTPDYYWDREELENLYLNTNSFLDINKRTRVFNEKLNYCTDIMRIVEANLNDKKHTRLEWIIISLITIEAFFGILSFIIK